MSFYDNQENVEQYITMAAGYDGKLLVDQLKEHLSAGSTVLEIGMGPGVDLDLLSRDYVATGSDRSIIFLDRYRAEHPGADLLQLDAVALETDRRFDALYSNKVLHHLTQAELTESLARQAALLNPGGLILHSFWAGDGTEEMHGMRFTYYTCESLKRVVTPLFEVVDCKPYTEMDDGDSLYLLARVRE
ncbi:MAG: class I SAM-dependent methyltransferase [Caldilineaceae bacterium]|nr:class I SAM-dependent methyltransferase [Caldilineaceae bacterium]